MLRPKRQFRRTAHCHRFPARPERPNLDRIASRVNQELIAGLARAKRPKQIINLPELRLSSREDSNFRSAMTLSMTAGHQQVSGFLFFVGSLSLDKQKLSRIARDAWFLHSMPRGNVSKKSDIGRRHSSRQQINLKSLKQSFSI
jgi:hypothetical protein